MLLKEGIIKIKKEDEEPFILKNKKSRFFIDIKEASLNPYILGELLNKFHKFFYDTLCFSSFDKFGSIAIGSIPIVTALSLEYKIPQIIIRSEKHESGIQSQVIGDCKYMNILLIEDVATTGESIIDSANAIREAGGICEKCIVIVDREEGAKENCLDNGIELYFLLKKSDFEVLLNIK